VQETLGGKSKVFLDPNAIDPSGLTSISGKKFSEDGELLAYGISIKGSDWVTIKVFIFGFTI